MENINKSESYEERRWNILPIAIIILVLLLPLISAADFGVLGDFSFDNYKKFNNTNSRYGQIEIWDGGFFSSDTMLSKTTLTSNTDYCLINCEARGTTELYYNLPMMRSLKMYDAKNGADTSISTKDIQIKTGETVIQIPRYDEVCVNNKLSINGTKTCTLVENGTQDKVTEVFETYDGTVLSAGTYEWKIVGQKGTSQNVDWTVAVMGFETKEWATWNATYENGLTDYFNMSSNGNLINGSRNLTVNDGQIGYNDTAINGQSGFFGLGNSMNMSGAEFQSVWNMSSSSNGQTISVWIKVTNTGGNRGLFGRKAGGTTMTWYLQGADRAQINDFATVDTGFTVAGTTNFRHLVIVSNSTTGLHSYVNGAYDSSSITAMGSSAGPLMFADNMIIAQTDDPNLFLDEVAHWERQLSAIEISDLYNGGTGIFLNATPGSFPNSTITTLNRPANYQNFTNNFVTFNCSAEGAGEPIGSDIVNITLEIDGITNLTVLNATSNQNLSLQTNLSMSEGSHNWTCASSLFSSTESNNIANQQLFNIDTLGPVVNITAPFVNVAYHRKGTNLTFNFSISETFPDTCIIQYEGNNGTGGTNTSISCTDTSISLNVTDFDNRTITIWANDTSGLLTVYNRTWNYSIYENARTFNATTADTNIENFDISILSDGLQNVTSQLIYGNSITSSTKIGNDSSMNFTNSVTISEGATKTFHWMFDYGGTSINSSNSTQTATSIDMGFCNATNNQVYVTFDFKNESSSDNFINASIDSTWTYWTSNPANNRTFAYVNLTENNQYNFCVQPADKTMNTKYIITYDNSESQQGSTDASGTFTNSTTNISLYLLESVAGLFSPFQTIDTTGAPVSAVLSTMTRTLNSKTITTFSGLTDSIGLINIFLDPDITYTATFSKTGLPSNTFTFNPTTETKLVTMGVTGEQLNGSQISINSSYVIKPSNSSLNNHTTYLFSFNVTSTQTINLISMNITNASGAQIFFVSNAGTGIISQSYNTANHTRLNGIFQVQTALETLRFTKSWTVGAEFEGDYSLYRQMRYFTDYGFQDFIKFLIVIILILGILIYMSSGEITDTSESKVIVAILLIWVFSAVGWLDNPTVATSTGLARFGRQYGVAIISTTLAMFFILRRIFIRRI